MGENEINQKIVFFLLFVLIVLKWTDTKKKWILLYSPWGIKWSAFLDLLSVCWWIPWKFLDEFWFLVKGKPLDFRWRSSVNGCIILLTYGFWFLLDFDESHRERFQSTERIFMNDEDNREDGNADGDEEKLEKKRTETPNDISENLLRTCSSSLQMITALS